MRTRARQEAAATGGRGVLLVLAGALAAALLGAPVAESHAATVTKLADTDGECTPDDCSLREAIKSGDNDIEFAADLAGEVVLRSSLPEISHDVDIRGPGPDELTVRPARPLRGGMIFAVVDGATVEISGLRVTDGTGFVACFGEDLFSFCNTAGGGIYNGPDSTLTIANTAVVANEIGSGGSRDFAQGGGIHNAGTMTIIDSTVSRNKVDGGWAGGISNTGTLSLINSTVSGNQVTAGEGGGIVNSSATLTIINSTVSGNRAHHLTGGIHSVGHTSRMTVKASTIANNPPLNLAAIFEGNTATLKSTILAAPPRWENCDDRDPHLGRGTLISEGYNLADDRSCKLTQGTDQPSTDPKLRPLGDYGGPTQTMALLPASPAIDKGMSDDLNTDQRGRPRPVDFPWVPNARGGDGADIGAFERQALVPFRFGKVRHSTRRGIARLAIRLTGPGRVILQRRPGVKRFAQVHRGEGAGRVVLRVRPRGKARQRLNRQARRTGQGRVRVRAQVTFRPWAGEPLTKGRRVRLVQR